MEKSEQLAIVQRTQLIEQTAKRFKLIRFAGTVLIMLAIVLTFSLNENPNSTSVGYKIAGTLGMLGVLTWSYGMMLSWWHHG